MSKTLTTRLARQAGVTRAEAADQLDRVFHQIVTDLRKGRSAALPGLGKFTPGTTWKFEFDKGGPGASR
jgi:nucleoid DNA-binding protein